MDIPRYALIAASVLLGLMLLGEWTQFSAKQQDAASPPTPMVEPSLVQDTPAAEAAPPIRHRTLTCRSERTWIYHRPDNKRQSPLTWHLPAVNLLPSKPTRWRL